MTRQEVLFLWLDTSALDSRVLGWAYYHGGDASATLEVPGPGLPPYASGVAALADGWRLIQVSQLAPPMPGAEYSTSYLKHEFVFEKLSEIPQP